MLKNALGAFLVTIALAGCTAETAEVQETPVRPVKVMEVGQAEDARQLRYSGSVRPRTEVATGFRIAGKIIERTVDIGDRVKAGDVLAKMDANDYTLSRQSAAAALEAAERQVETTSFAMKRAEQLFSRQAVAKAQVEQAQLAYRQAVAQQESAQTTLEQARNQVSYSELKADHDGIVTAIHADAGQVVATGSPVLTLAVDGEKEVAIAVPETDIFAFKPGIAVKVSLWADADVALTGTVREVSGSADASSRTFAVRVSLPDDPRVLLGMTAGVSASADKGTPFVTVPLAALARDASNQTLVWTVDRQQETVHARPVSVADFGDDGVRISGGLNSGDLVVVAGTQFMAEDLKVKLPAAVAQQTAHAADGTAQHQIR